MEVRVGTLNVGTMTGKGRELADMMERRNVDILCIQETTWKGSKARRTGGGLKLFYHGVDGRRNWVEIMLKEEHAKSVLEVKRVSDRVMSMKLETECVMMNIVSAYAPQVGCEVEEEEEFWSEFNGHVGEDDEEVMGRYGVKVRSVEGQMVMEFEKRMEIAVNTMVYNNDGDVQSCCNYRGTKLRVKKSRDD